MVSIRCKMLVKKILEEQEIQFITIELGEVVLDGPITSQQRSQLAKTLKEQGLELIISRTSILVERIKIVIIQVIHFSEKRLKKNFSHFLAEKLNYSYTYLSKVFSRSESSTIEKFVIRQKIERVKDLLMNEDLTLTEISYQLEYSSVAHLSAQFKKVTGFTPTHFKRLCEERLATV